MQRKPPPKPGTFLGRGGEGVSLEAKTCKKNHTHGAKNATNSPTFPHPEEILLQADIEKAKNRSNHLDPARNDTQ